jgi:hypothetical protein
MVGSSLLAAHLSPSLLFDEIEARTLSSVRFSNFQFGVTTGGKYSISMSGLAKSFNAVALQSDAFGHSDIISNPIFSNINFDQTGAVAFDVTASVNPARISYTGVSNAPTVPTATSTTP